MYLNEALYQDFLSTKEILWLGIDFSKAKVTKSGFNVSQEELRNCITYWNTLIISDQKKYDIRLSFRKPVMSYDLTRTNKINKNIRINNMLKENITMEDVYTDECIVKYIRETETPTLHRFGLSFIIESLDSLSKTGSIWVVINETPTKEPVLCEKFLKVPSGFGLKSYWSRIFYDLLYDVRVYAFHRWENLIKH